MERDDLLGAAACGMKATRRGEVHRTGARILAVGGNRQDLRTIGHLDQYRVRAGVEADDGGALPRRTCGRGAGRASRQHQRRKERAGLHIRLRTPMNAPRPGEP